MLYDLNIPDYFATGVSYFGAPLQLNTKITVLGRELRHDYSYNWNGLKRGNHEFVLWQFTLSGRGRLDYEGESFDLHPGEAMLIHVPHRHRYYFPPDSTHWDFIFMIMDGVECVRICRELEEKNGPVIRYKGKTSSLETAERIFAAATVEGNALRMSALCYEFCLNLASDLIEAGSMKEQRPHAVEAAIRFALNHFETPVGVGEMSEVAGLSRFHFTRLFHQYMNVTPGEFLRKLRLEKAMHMLQSERIGIAEIAERSGFQSASYFCRAFRHVFGVAPSEFREGKTPRA